MPAKDQIITLAELEKEIPGITEFIKEKYNTTNPEQTWKSLGAFQRNNDKKNFERKERGFKKTGPKEGQLLGEFRKDEKAIKVIKDNYGKLKNNNIAKLAFPKLKFVTALRRTEQLIRQLKQDGQIKPMKTYQSLEAIDERPEGAPEFEKVRKQTKARLGRVKKVSDLYKEKQFQKAKKFSGTDLAHRLSLSLNFADDYNVSQLGVERPEINRLLVAPTENKLIAIYKKQKKLIKEANKKGLTKDISKKLEAENKKVSDLVAKTDGRLQGIHIDEKTLKAKPVGMNYGFSIDFGLFDKPVKELTPGEVEFIQKATIPQAVKAELAVDPKKVLTEFKERGLQITPEAEKKVNELVKTVKSSGQCRKLVAAALGGSIDTCEAVIRNNPEEASKKILQIKEETGPIVKAKNAALSFLKSPGFKTFSVAGLAGGAAAALVKEFRNDDPTTYLSNEDQQKSMLVEMATDPIMDPLTNPMDRPGILDYQLPAVGASLAASTAIAAPSTIKASRSRGLGVEQKGLMRTTGRVLGRGLGVAATPGVLAPLAAMDIADQISQGDSPVDIATNPFNYLYPAFADQTPKMTKGLPSAFRKFARLGLGRAALTGLSRLGIGGLGASLAIQGLGLLDD